MATARRTRVCFSPASRRPRSANTFPELRATVSLFSPFTISGLVIVCSGPEPSGDQFHVRASRFFALRRFLLKCVQHIDSTLKLHRIDLPVSVAPVVRDDFENSGTDPLPGLRAGVLPSKLRHAERHSDCILHGFRKIQEIDLGGAYPKQGPFSGDGFRSRHDDYPSSRIFRL